MGFFYAINVILMQRMHNRLTMKINQKQKELIKIYIFLFILMFTIINWENISWMFNYREVSSLVYSFFNPYQDSDLLVSASNIKLPAKNPQPAAVNMAVYPYSEKSNSVEIPRFNVSVPLVIGQNTDTKSLERDLDNGVVYYPGSVLPGENGQIAVLGHSAPPNWPKIKYDWAFTQINDLQAGDQIIMHFNNRKYTYTVTEKSIIKVGQEISTSGLTGSNNILTLVSCWPPGKDYQRIAVYSELAPITP